jgi:hypothetical protein
MGNATGPVSAVRLGPGQFLLDTEHLGVGVAFTVEGRTFTVVSKPVAHTTRNCFVVVRETAGPEIGRQLTMQLRFGCRE